MADLLSQNIGTNYKSILNLDATTINTPLDATLRAVTDGMGTSSPLQLSTGQVGISRTVALSAGATNPRLFNEVYTINNSGAQTGTLTGLFLNATETALNGITHNLMDLQVGGVSKFSVDRVGITTMNTSVSSVVRVTSINNFNNSLTMFTLGATNTRYEGTLFQFNGTTSSFPAIKRNGTGIDFKLADDSANCSIGALNITALGGIAAYSTIEGYSSSQAGSFTGSVRVGFGGSNTTSAILDVVSTTKGVLFPRMTTTQKNAIATPAAGLVVYDTTLAKLCVYTTAWETITSS